MPYPCQCLDSSHQTLNSPSDHTRHGSSKAQMCFFKILRLISSAPAYHNPIPKSSPTAGIAIDLNLRFRSDDAEFQCNSPHRSHSDGDRGEQTDQDAGNASVQVGARHEETKIEAEMREEEEEEEEGGMQNENNRLHFLIEAASVISRKLEEVRSEIKKSRMVVNMQDKSPVVRTKRWRSQALLYMFRLQSLRHGTVKTQGSSSQTIVDHHHGFDETTHR